MVAIMQNLCCGDVPLTLQSSLKMISVKERMIIDNQRLQMVNDIAKELPVLGFLDMSGRNDFVPLRQEPMLTSKFIPYVLNRGDVSLWIRS